MNSTSVCKYHQIDNMPAAHFGINVVLRCAAYGLMVYKTIIIANATSGMEQQVILTANNTLPLDLLLHAIHNPFY
jgi:hypothetical protein